jgi:hypothetical protein
MLKSISETPETRRRGYAMTDEAVRHENYMAYMLRLWQAGSNDGKLIWRASLENPHTGERQAFGDMETLIAFLMDRTNSPIDPRNELDTFGRTAPQEERTLP